MHVRSTPCRGVLKGRPGGGADGCAGLACTKAAKSSLSLSMEGRPG